MVAKYSGSGLTQGVGGGSSGFALAVERFGGGCLETVVEPFRS